ncbi:conserved protein of unknown function [Burkholderia multivorans]
MELVVADARWRTCQLWQERLEVVPTCAVVDWRVTVDLPLSFSFCRDHLEIFTRWLRHCNSLPISERQFDGGLVIAGSQIRRCTLFIEECTAVRLCAICLLWQL